MDALVVSIAVVVLVSAVCSLFEAVLYSVPVSHVEALAQAGKPAGRILRQLRLGDIDRPISAILSLNTIANTGGAFVAGAAFIKVFGAEWSPYFTVFLTMTVLFLSEIIPKTVGVVHSRTLAAVIAHPLQILVWALTPMVALSRLTTRLVSRGREQEAVSERDLIAMARLGQKAGVLEPDESRVIQNILSLKNKAVRDVMTPRTVLFTLDANLTAEEAFQETGTWPHSRVPVYEENLEDTVGVVLSRDVFAAIADNRGQTRLVELMRPVNFVSESSSLDRVLRYFLERREHLFVVLDEFGSLAGVLSLEDVLEEILGKEIVDEFDEVTDMRELARRRRQETLEGR